MASQLEIINIALSRLGESPIQSLNEGSVPANAAKLLYDTERKATLRAYPWNFALRQTTLARLEGGAVDFSNAFALPVDNLRVLQVWDSTTKQELRYSTRGGRLYSDSEKVTIEYVADVKEAHIYDSKFVEAFSYRLASTLAMPVKGSPELMANYMNIYQGLVSEAATQSAREEEVYLSDNPYLEARM